MYNIKYLIYMILMKAKINDNKVYEKMYNQFLSNLFQNQNKRFKDYIY